MESTGVVAINQSVDASSFIRASRKVPGEMLEAETNAGGNFSLFTACCPFVWGSLAALVAVVPSAGVRLCRLFCRCWVLSGVVFRTRFPLFFARQGHDPRTDLWQVTQLLWRKWHWFTALRIRWVRLRATWWYVRRLVISHCVFQWEATLQGANRHGTLR